MLGRLTRCPTAHPKTWKRGLRGREANEGLGLGVEAGIAEAREGCGRGMNEAE